MLRKFGWVFHAQHVALPYSYPFYQYDVPTWLRFYVIGPWLLVPLGLVGIVFAAPRPRRADYFIWAAFVPSYAAAVALFFMSERYRLPLLVPLVAGAGGAIDYLITQVTMRRLGAIAAPLAAGVVLGVLVNTHRIAGDGRWEEGVRMAHELIVLGRYDEAETWVKRLEDTAVHQITVNEGVGRQYILDGQPARALPHLMKAAALDPRRAMTQYALGEALLELDRPAEALPHLQQGFDAGVDVRMAGYPLAVALEKTRDLSGAAAVIPRIVMGDDASQDEWLRVGRLAAELHAPEAAEPFFRHAVEMNANQPDARQQYGVNLLVLNRFADAARELTEAARLDPKDAATFSHLAYCEAKLGRLPDARQHLAAALALDPGDPMALQLAAVLK
jgi:Flp pilus assembly protein TadD